MKETPVKVDFIGKKGQKHLIKLPNINSPVSLNENLHLNMWQSDLYRFKKRHREDTGLNSA